MFIVWNKYLVSKKWIGKKNKFSFLYLKVVDSSLINDNLFDYAIYNIIGVKILL